MNGDQRSIIDQILSAIEYGKLSRAETERRVEALIDAEMSKPDDLADMESVRACEDLLMELHAHGLISFESHRQENCAAVTKRFSDWQKRKKNQQRIVRTVACAAVVVLCFVGAGRVFHWSWLVGTSSTDGMQYLIQGHQVELDTIRDAIAAHNNLLVFDTQNIDELNNYLGFESNIPVNIHQEWFPTVFHAFIFPDWIQVTTEYNYASDSTWKIITTQYWYTSIEDAISIFEQDMKGESINIGSHSVYVSRNEDSYTASWITGNTTHHAICSTSAQMLTAFVEFYLKGD